ncbi:hypothetical protein JD81_05905 [Micromonospora sagamiensis]|uniref:Uncharacterized protein n=1 Tax=Micromonospora sagamiensis TaxID=47875 RepID=A0A562WPR7_9ACTN|nr:hypothetical protein [Micromonospora sagamiensis]TWJ32330.1 hypothetical protein JD81_05905 [Micromonospora sagamiensis]
MSGVVFVLSPAAMLAAVCEPFGDYLRRGSDIRTSPRHRCSGWRASAARAQRRPGTRCKSTSLAGRSAL